MSEELPSFTCPFCGMRSYHPKDIEHRYCGRCGVFVDDELERRRAEAKIEWGKDMRALRWTTRKPTVDGPYWWRASSEHRPPVLVEVSLDEERNRGIVFYFGVSGTDELSRLPGEWFGPLKAPP